MGTVHGWLPDTYEKAPTPVTMVLTGLMSKMGLVGMVKMVIPLLPYVPSSVLQATLAIAVFGLVYSALAAMGQTSFKRLLAYSSINHLGYCLIALLVLGQPSMGEPSMQTAKTFALVVLLLQMFSHGLIAAGLFYLTHLGKPSSKNPARRWAWRIACDHAQICGLDGPGRFCLHWIARLERVYRGVSHLSRRFCTQPLGCHRLTTSIIDHSHLSLEISAACFPWKIGSGIRAIQRFERK